MLLALGLRRETQARRLPGGGVFGGMGSWSDLSLNGLDRAEYDRVSEKLFTTLNEAIYTGANSSCASRTNT
jgi:hypothetical protein